MCCKAQKVPRALQHHRQPRHRLLVFCRYGHKWDNASERNVLDLCGQPKHLGLGAQCHQGVWCHAPHRAPGGRKTSCAFVGRSRSRLTAACTPAGAAGAATAGSPTPMAAGPARLPARTRPGFSKRCSSIRFQRRFQKASRGVRSTRRERSIKSSSSHVSALSSNAKPSPWPPCRALPHTATTRATVRRTCTGCAGSWARRAQETRSGLLSLCPTPVGRCNSRTGPARQPHVRLPAGLNVRCRA
jgi:hypothetical protein